MEDAIVDKKGRILVPKEVRARLDLRPETRLRVRTKGKELVLSTTGTDARTFTQESAERTVAHDAVKAVVGAAAHRY